MPQKIHIWSKNTHNPVLLFLHGGPGIPNRHKIRSEHLDLCDHFTVVGWDQRGTGGSYARCPAESLTLEQLIEDAEELSYWLCEVFDKEKLFILGGSWGTQLGSFLALKHPELVEAYLGFGQVVSGIKNEEISYNFALSQAEAAGDTQSIEILTRIGPPVRGVYNPIYEGLVEQRKIMNKYGGYAVEEKDYILGTALPILASPEYSIRDTWGILKGNHFCLENMWPRILDYDFLRDNPEPVYEMPYYIFQGKHDNNTPSSLVEEYYERIQAPKKDLIWFEHSAHSPLSEEPERFKKLLYEKFLG